MVRPLRSKVPRLLSLEEADGLYMGIDPGKQGGISILFGSGHVYNVYQMPETERDIWELFQDVEPSRIKMCVIERVHSMPQQSAQSGFTFGRGYGGLRMALVAARIPFEDVPPEQWMKVLGIVPKKRQTKSPKEKKLALRDKAQALYPTLSVWKQTKGFQMAVCDSLLIANYCRRVHLGVA